MPRKDADAIRLDIAEWVAADTDESLIESLRRRKRTRHPDAFRPRLRRD